MLRAGETHTHTHNMAVRVLTMMMLCVVDGGRLLASRAAAQNFRWVDVDGSSKMRVMDRFFGTSVDSEQTCNVFLIEGVPSAAMLYTRNNTHGTPIVDSFYLNHGMLLLYDGGAAMRSSLYRRYRRISILGSSNVDEFLAC